jgi:transposase IS4-like protein/DDE family transposase
LPIQCAISTAVTTLTRTITVAAGVFAPGHLGELTWQVPFELADCVLEDARAAERRLRDLPSRAGLYFVLALGLFPLLGYGQVWGKLTAALGGVPGVPSPSAKALRDLRRRVGAAPVKALFDVLAGPVGQPAAPGVRFGRLRTVSFDGCNSLKVPDTVRNRAWLGKQKQPAGETGYPVVSLMALVETGTRALLGAVFGPRTGETGYAAQLVRLLAPDMLVLTDRGFDSGGFLQAVAARAQFLARLTACRTLPAAALLDDGTYLSRIGGLTVRVIDAQVTVTLAGGARFTARYRLATTLLNCRRHPAPALIRLYHERWEHEVAYLALRHTLLNGRVLRSHDPAGLEQEIWALLTVYQAIRREMTAAAETVPGTDPDRASFTIALQAVIDTLASPQVIPPGQPLGHIGRAVLAGLLPPRRPRVSSRKVKSPLSRWHLATPERPARSTPLTAISAALQDPPAPAQRRKHRRTSLTTTTDP